VKLQAVACSGPAACMAAGNYYDTDAYSMSSPPSLPVAITYDGTAWTLAAAS
jgi:hypothetical protein